MTVVVDRETGEVMESLKAEVPIRIISADDVRASIKRARRSLEKAAEEIVWQIEMEAWVTLGYTSWSAMREAEYGGAAFMVPSKSRPELVARIKELEVGKTARGGSKHLTNQEIANTVGVSESQVRADLVSTNKSATSDAFVEDVVDAELVEDDEPDRPMQNAETDPVAAESVPITVTCSTCGGTGKVTR